MLGTYAYTQPSARTSDLLLGAAQVGSGIGIGATLVPVMSAAFRGLEPASVPRASTSIRIMQELGGSFGSAALFTIVQHQITAHPHTAAGLAAAFSTTFWWVLTFAAAMLAAVHPRWSGVRCQQPAVGDQRLYLSPSAGCCSAAVPPTCRGTAGRRCPACSCSASPRCWAAWPEVPGS